MVLSGVKHIDRTGSAWAANVFNILPEDKSQMVMVSSADPLIKMLPLEVNFIVVTWYVCFFSILIHFLASIDHNRMVKSSEHEARTSGLIGENAMSETPIVWPLSSVINSPVSKLNTLIVESDELVAKHRPFGDTLTEVVGNLWPLLIAYLTVYRSSTMALPVS